MEKLWNTIKSFLTSDQFRAWLEPHLLYFFFIGVGVALILIVILIIKVRKQIKQMDKDKRKREKQLLKFLSGKKNKTF